MRDQTKSKCKVALIDPKCPILPKMAKAVKDNLDGPKWLKNDLPTSVFKFSLQLIFGSPCWKAVTYTGLSTFLPKRLFWRDGTVTLVIIHISLLYFGKPYHINLANVKNSIAFDQMNPIWRVNCTWYGPMGNSQSSTNQTSWSIMGGKIGNISLSFSLSWSTIFSNKFF